MISRYSTAVLYNRNRQLQYTSDKWFMKSVSSNGCFESEINLRSTKLNVILFLSNFYRNWYFYWKNALVIKFNTILFSYKFSSHLFLHWLKRLFIELCQGHRHCYYNNVILLQYLINVWFTQSDRFVECRFAECRFSESLYTCPPLQKRVNNT